MPSELQEAMPPEHRMVFKSWPKELPLEWKHAHTKELMAENKPPNVKLENKKAAIKENMKTLLIDTPKV